MSRLDFLTNKEKEQYDTPPKLTNDERAIYFTANKTLQKKINRLHSATNKIGFLVQYGYFLACRRFFNSELFEKKDIMYVSNLLGLRVNEFDLNKYKRNMSNLHKAAILELQGYKALEGNLLVWFNEEVQCRAKQFMRPEKVFFEMLQLLLNRHIELPSYHLFATTIAQYYSDNETQLLQTVNASLADDIKGRLDELLSTKMSANTGTITQLKTINQSKEPKAIKASIETFKKVANCFEPLHSMMSILKLSQHALEYYAGWVRNAKLSQLKQVPNQDKLYLHLVSFIQHQYYLRQDTFIDIFLKAVQTAKNTTSIRLSSIDKTSRLKRNAAIQHITQRNQGYRSLVAEIKTAVESPVLTSDGKIEEIARLIEQHELDAQTIKQEKLDDYEQTLSVMTKEHNYYDILEKLSIKLQMKASPILKILDFNEDNSDKNLMTAIANFKTLDGNIHQKSPKDFLTPQEQKALLASNGKFRVSLYKILLFIHVSDGIKSGKLNLKYSYRYLSIQDYLVNKVLWDTNKDKLLARTELDKFADYDVVMAELKQRLDDKYQAVNQRLLDGRNPYLSINDAGQPYIKTPAAEDKSTEHITAFLSQVNYVPIFNILSEVDAVSNFTQAFKHHNIKNTHKPPSPQTLAAGIIGLGCNIGVPKISQISEGVNHNTLRNTVIWYFSLKNIETANNSIISYINQLSLPEVFMEDNALLHSSSDGRKVNVAVDCLLANKSFKYFGKDSGVSIYTFIDERQALFYSTVISASEREAAYVIDGLQNNDVVKTDIHSTDTHGYMETLFASTHLLERSLAPRIKNIGKQKIYSFTKKETYEKKGYKLLPSRSINRKLIKQHWDDILRFMVTIKLREVSASQLFKRLSSYAKDNPLYKALKEFGRIIKSLFILTYYDDVKLRQRIEKQLNRIELANKFGRAVFYANNSEFKKASTEDLKVITACTTLIQNAIVLWNYLYLSQLLTNCAGSHERQELIGLIKEGSVLTWAHVNLQGQFDFRQKAANDPYFDMKKILKLAI